MLVGFMAAGKTTVGRILARRLGWELVDFDEVIQDRMGQTAGAIIREHGEFVFRALEAELTGELAGRSNVILSPGGGWGADPRRAGELGQGTVRVWLRVSAGEAVRRARKEGVERPLLGDGPEAEARAAELLRERETAYATADITVDVNGREPEAVADEIVRRLGVESGGR